jgi:hypothetical protein
MTDTTHRTPITDRLAQRRAIVAITTPTPIK